MANITIKELLAADTVSEIVDKINFNFDQLLLNGGGPIGPIGNEGEIGPIGPRGTIWFTVADLYTTPTSPMWTGTSEMVNDINQPNYPQYKGDPNKFLPIGLGNAIESTLIFGTINKQLRDGDLYIQESDDTLNSFSSFDGDIWEFDGISQTWLYTGVNIKGETGQSGTSGLSQWSRFTDSTTDVLYPTENTGQDIPKILIGVSSNIQDNYDPQSAITIVTPGSFNLALGNTGLHGNLTEILNTGKLYMTANGELVIEGSNTNDPSDFKEIILRSYTNTRIISGDALIPNPTEYIQNSILNEHLFQSGRIKVKSNNINNTVHQLLNNEFADVGIDFILKPTGTTQLHRINTDSGHDLILQGNSRKVGIGTFIGAVGSKLSVDGNVSIGASYKTLTTGPSNGLIVQGNTGIGYSSPNNTLSINGRISVGNNGTLLNNTVAEFSGESAGTVRTIINIRTNELDGADPSTALIQFLPSRLQSNNTTGTLGSRRGGIGFWDRELIMSTSNNPSNTGISIVTGGPSSLASPVRIKITQSGNVGFNTTSPSTTVDINSSNSGTGLRVRGGNPQPGQTLTASDTNGNTVWTNDGVPTGAIIMWGGAANAIPVGWQLCDGSTTSGNLAGQLFIQGFPFGFVTIGNFPNPRVPDLRERFVVGAGGNNPNVTGGAYAVGDTGGDNTVALTGAQMPQHNHSVNAINIPSSGAHSHTIPSVNNDGNFSSARRSSAPGPNNIQTNTGGAHTHTVPAHNTNKTGSGTPHENRPPYFALCYIIKTT